MSNQIKHLYEFKKFRLDAETPCLWQDNELVPIPLKALQILILLVERNGEIVSREELLEKVWNETFVEEANITYTISLLRKSLGDKKLVQTVPKRGYRFTAEIKKAEETSQIAISEKKENSVEKNEENKSFPIVEAKKKRRVVLSFVSVISLFFLMGSSYYFFGDYHKANVSPNRRNIKTLAVLPFKNLDKDDEETSLSLGLTDLLISRLGSLKRWTVRPFSAVEKFEKSKKDSIEFGKELKCDAVLVGTFQAVENRLRVNARLLDTRDGTQIWTASFNEDESDIFQLQDNLAKQVAGSLIEKLTDADKKILGKEYTENAEAYRAYLTGRMLFERPKKDSFQTILDDYQKAVSLDPSFALAYSALADLFVRQGNLLSGRESRNAYKKARIYAQRAVELDGDLSQAQTSMGRVYRIADWNWDESEKYLKRAIELNASDLHAHILYGHLYIFRRDYDAALKMYERAIEIDPVTPATTTLMLHVLEGRGDFKEGLQRSEEFFNFDKGSTSARVAYSRFLFHNGEYEKVIQLAEASLEDRKAYNYQWFSLLTASYRRLGQIEKADEYLRKLETSAGKNTKSLHSLAVVYAELDRFDEAINALEKCYEQHEELLVWMTAEPRFGELKNDFRFQEIARKMRLIQ